KIANVVESHFGLPPASGPKKRKRAPRVGGDALSNPAGCGERVGRRYNARALRLFHGEQKRRREHSGPRLLPHKQPRVEQLTALDTQTPGAQIYSLRSKGNCRSATERG